MNTNASVSFAGHRAATTGRVAKRGHILVIDDDPLFATAMERCLAVDHEVVSVNSADDALRLLDRGACFDLIFCDLMMPDMNGMDFFATVTARFREHAMRTVFLTGGAFAPEVQTFLDAVPNPTLEKPFDVGELKRLAREWVGEPRPIPSTDPGVDLDRGSA